MCVLLYTPIGNGNKGGFMVFTGLPGLIKAKQIFSHPVTSWTVPFPALKEEGRGGNKRGGEEERLARYGK